MQDNIKLVALGLQVTSVILFSSSFFVRDNNKAVNRRYWALGIGIAGIGLTIVPKLKLEKYK